MLEGNVKKYVARLFQEINHEVQSIIASSVSLENATRSIAGYVVKRVTAASKGFVFDLYSELSRATLQEPVFRETENANRFYALNIMDQIADACSFKIQDPEAFEAGLNINRINPVYTSAAVAVGAAAVGGILLEALSGAVPIPKATIMAGAVIVGLASGGVAYAKIIPEHNTRAYTQNAHTVMTGLEEDMMFWLDEVVTFYNQKIEGLRKTL